MHRAWLNAVGWVIAACVFGSIWFPVYHHFAVQVPTLSDDVLTRARTSPSDTTLEQASEFKFLMPQPVDNAQLMTIAEQLLNGRLEMQQFLHLDFNPHFSPQDFTGVDSSVSLFVASLGIPSLLIDAYLLSADQKYLQAAALYIRNFAAYEASAWQPRGNIWNDHALAARSATLSRFWLVYRRHPLYERATARSTLELVQRNAAFLSKPGHFTYATNHGVMQNLALLLIAIVFPELPNTSELSSLAQQRLAFAVRTLHQR